MRWVGFLLMWMCAATALAQSAELGARYWLSSGDTRWSHNAQGSNPVLGNPTSILSYEDLVAHSVELYGRRNFGGRWFVRGNAGLGWIQDGTLDDEDYFRGQIKFSDTTSPVQGNKLSYASIDVGRDLWVVNRGRTTVGVFAGFHHWTERADGYGVHYTVNFFGLPERGDTIPAISNEATWESLRLGVAMSTVPGAKTRMLFDVAWIPYAKLASDDSHYLRSDLGPVPNVFIRGRGQGLQLDFEVKHKFAAAWELGFGARYWWLEATHGSVTSRVSDDPLISFESQRVGFTASLTRRW
jgi:hypothetical protein